ncbi:acetyl-CoA synthetase-like protein [Coniophora puteana RWD-64-598 SS2]|uniref:Acetyl-CoA synthetase-like protein n=1 Tax=Coniophora puteana (strain RWD-64-598) TaxID=741705 RepID=A0A5M3MZ43_CONPW|nr:acetyl-CoA synthetase-like protein [Coniophora puteana RWD-64-598 SS2]EIW84433.1 acetyl-CoA synthetase-like protein [Coniophora puteana RWD-64-598 SS2]
MVMPKIHPSLPQTQALNSDTFSLPPLDSSLNFAEVMEWTATHSPTHPLFKYPLVDGGVRTICWAEAYKAVLAGCKILRQRIKASGEASRPVVGILSISDVIPYSMNLLSCFRLNFVPFPISARNSSVALAHLIEHACITHILLGRDSSMHDLLQSALSVLREKHPESTAPEVLPMLQFDEVYSPSTETVQLPEVAPFVSAGPDAKAIIIHSSGSTAFPKPIAWPNRCFDKFQYTSFFGGHDLTGLVLSLHTVPMYHMMGIYPLYCAAACGLVVSAFQPTHPVILPTSDNLYTAAKSTQSDIIFCVPSILEQWATNPEYVQWLASRSGAQFGGGPLNKEVGDYLTSQGVNLFLVYGLTETGAVATVFPEPAGYDWDYFTLSKSATVELIPYGDKTYEPVIVPSEFSVPCVFNTTVNGVPAYATSDLLSPHPTKAGLWKVFGRTDDQIMHSTGEKTNPGPLESILNQDENIMSSVMFGRGKFQAGVIIDPVPKAQFDPTNEAKLAEFRNLIWPTVEAMNAYAPQHSRLFKEMIIVANPLKPFTYTSKNTPRRGAIINLYSDEIEEAYAAVDKTTQSSIPPPSEWNSTQTLKFVGLVVRSVLGKDVPDNVDIFQFGCDSLQATWIRNSILRALRDSSSVDTRSIKENVVYTNTSISSLSNFFVKFADGNTSDDSFSIPERMALMQSLVSKYLTKHLPVHQPRSPPQGSGVVFLVTGTTGHFGSHILASLIEDATVARIYALNRPSSAGQAIGARQAQAFSSWGLDVTLLKADKVVLLEGDALHDSFGLDELVYNEMTESVTHIIHNAWTVNFNLGVNSFEDNIRSLRRLVDFSLGSPLDTPPKLAFVSSIGVLQNAQGTVAVPEAPVSAEIAVGSGYAESKWVAEEILRRVEAYSPTFNALVVRVGQLCGGTITGSWSTTEWFPALVQSVKATKCIPTDNKPVSWIPTDLAASILVKLTSSSFKPKGSIVHLIHPDPVAFSILADAIASALDVPTVAYNHWLSRLQILNDDKGNGASAENIRALRLLTFFQEMSSDRPTGEAMGAVRLDCTQLKESSALQSVQYEPLGAVNAQRWLEYWRSVDFL